MKLFLFIILSLFLAQACEAQSQLPEAMPEEVRISLNESGGMSRAYKKIRIENGVLEFEELTGGNRQAPQKWSAKISAEDLAGLYRVFVENKFDAVKNDTRQGVVYDAGSQSISITVNKTKSFQVTYGKNSPLSGRNLQRYKAVSEAIFELVAQYENRKSIDSSNNAPAGEVEKYIQGTWRAEGENNQRSWFLEWTFAGGKFKQTGYPPILQEGSYRIVNVADGRITIELFAQKGNFGDQPRTIEIVTDPEDEKLTISGTKGFLRVARKN